MSLGLKGPCDVTQPELANTTNATPNEASRKVDRFEGLDCIWVFGFVERVFCSDSSSLVARSTSTWWPASRSTTARRWSVAYPRSTSTWGSTTSRSASTTSRSASSRFRFLASDPVEFATVFWWTDDDSGRRTASLLPRRKDSCRSQPSFVTT